jgi:hypothetical protein
MFSKEKLILIITWSKGTSSMGSSAPRSPRATIAYTRSKQWQSIRAFYAIYKYNPIGMCSCRIEKVERSEQTYIHLTGRTE